jgi:regulator of replication initiation timing
MDLVIPYPVEPIFWSLLLIVGQQVYQLTQNPPRRKIDVEVGKKVKGVNRILARITRLGPNVADEETMANVENSLNAIRDEIMRIQTMNRVQYLHRSKECQNRLKEMVHDLHENVQLLSTSLVADIHQHVVEHTRLAEENSRLRAENATLLRRQVNASVQREEENAHVPTMQQSVQGSSTEQEQMHDDEQGNARLVPYVNVMIKQEKDPLLPYCIGDASIPFAECLGRIDLDSSSENHRPDEVFEVGEPVPFIHFHHTCDSCMMFPIIGKRFRAMNHRDFDLCQGCFSNSNITCLSFEETEVVSDRHHQLAWRRALGLEKD